MNGINAPRQLGCKLLIITLAFLVFGGCPLFAANLDAFMEVTWGLNTIPFDVQPTAELLKSDFSSFEPPVVGNLITFDNENYSVGFFNISSEVTYIVFAWDDGFYNWGDLDPGGEIITYDWSGSVTLEATATGNGRAHEAYAPDIMLDFFNSQLRPGSGSENDLLRADTPSVHGLRSEMDYFAIIEKFRSSTETRA